MNNEMMLFQARQDFIDMHKDLQAGQSITLEKYDQISADLKSMDDLNFELILEFVEQTESIQIKEMWEQISAYIDQVKRSGSWQDQKLNMLSWAEDQQNKLIVK